MCELLQDDVSHLHQRGYQADLASSGHDRSCFSGKMAVQGQDRRLDECKATLPVPGPHYQYVFDLCRTAAGLCGFSASRQEEDEPGLHAYVQTEHRILSCDLP